MSSETQTLPAGWCEATLPEVVQINPDIDVSSISDGMPITFVPMASVGNLTGQIDTSILRPWSEVKKGYTRFQERDVLFAKITPCMENGKTAIARDLQAGIGAGSTEFHVLRAGAALLPELLLHYVLREDFRKAARAEMTGTAGQLRVPTRFFSEQRIIIPPVSEQHRIIEAIDSYITRLDDTRSTLEKVQRNLKRYRASVLKAAVEGKLVPTEAELARTEGRDYEPASVLLQRILAERRRRWEDTELAKMKAKGKVPKDDKWKAKYVEPVGPEKSGLPELPEGWCWATIDQLSVLVRNGYSKRPSSEGKVRILRISAVRAMNIDLEDCKWLPGQSGDYFLDLVQPGDLLFTRYNGSPALVGVSALVRTLNQPTVHPDKLIKVRFRSDDLNNAYLELSTNAGISRQFLERRTRTTSGQIGISGSDVKELPVPLPPFCEQGRIAEEVERLLTVIKSLSATAFSSYTRGSRLRQSILKWAFEGRLVDQDPNDEPASVLLERIRAERAAKPAKSTRRPRTTTRKAPNP